MIRAGKRAVEERGSSRSHGPARWRNSWQPHHAAARRMAMTPEERQHLIEAALARYREVLEQRLANEPRTLNEIEQAVEEIGQVMEDDLERRLLERKERPAIPEDNQAGLSALWPVGPL